MAGELGITERPKPVNEVAKEFILSLPPEGLIFHGTLNKKIGEIREQGLIGKKWLGLHFLSFTPQNTRLDSSKNIKDTIQRFRNSIKKNVLWAGIHTSLNDMDPENIVEGNLPAIVVAKRPADSRPAEYAQPNEFPHDYSYIGVTPENILTIVSLTPEEYRKIMRKIKASKVVNQSVKMRILNEEAGKILSRKVLKDLTQINGL